MAITYVNSGAAGTTASGTLTVPVPTGVVNGDVMLMVVEVGSTTLPSVPAGWTSLDTTTTTIASFTAYRVASSEPASYATTVAGRSVGAIFAYRGASNSSPVNAHGAFTFNTTSTITANSITTTTDGCQIVFLSGINCSANLTVTSDPTSFTRRTFSPNTTPTAGCYGYGADLSQATAGAVGSQTLVLSSSGFFNAQATMVALAPTASAPSNTVAPAVTGTATVGQTLTTDNGTWSNTPTGYTYQWQDSADGSTGWANVASATANTYTIASAELAKYMRCVVTATNGGGSTAANSNVVGAVSAPTGAPYRVLERRRR